jgi:hypothetical protein
MTAYPIFKNHLTTRKCEGAFGPNAVGYCAKSSEYVHTSETWVYIIKLKSSYTNRTIEEIPHAFANTSECVYFYLYELWRSVSC